VTGSDGSRNRTASWLSIVGRYQALLWWTHSAWALGCGVAVMWVGAHHFGFVRIAVWYVAIIWLVSLLMPMVLAHRRLDGRTGHWVRLGLNYMSRNFYQQILFFILPIYYASATPRSANMIFVALLAISAVLSTLDVIYDRHLSTDRNLVAVFFALNLFACLAAALPILWHVGPALALRISASLAFMGYVSFYLGRRIPSTIGPWVAMMASALLLTWISGNGQRFIPPVPIRLVDSVFGSEIDRGTLTARRPLESLPVGWSGQLGVVTAIRAPMGLQEGVRHRWAVDGAVVSTTDVHRLAGGRPGGFRLWTALPLTGVRSGSRITVDVETAGGQLIGRAAIRVGTDH
jgi:Family of unknown function (DUF5924)